jgi:enoyl-CoA hydratase/carnithine racemase
MAATPPTFETLEVTIEGPVGRLTLVRPEQLNPLSNTTLVELADAAYWFDRHCDASVVVVSGQGRAFSAGADLSGLAARGSSAAPADEPREVQAWRRGETGRRMADAVERMRQVTVAAIRGHCVGGGVVLASVCDLRVATQSARFVIPEVALGIPLTWGGVPRLMREIGPAMTRELVMTCRPFDGREAKEVGFVNRVVPDDQLDAAVEDLVAQLVDKSPYTLEVTKHHLRALAEEMVGAGRSFADADSLVTAGVDPSSRAVGRSYLEAFRARRGPGRA